MKEFHFHANFDYFSIRIFNKCLIKLVLNILKSEIDTFKKNVLRKELFIHN